MKAAVDLLADHDSPYEKIIIVRPAVEAEEKLGSLPGNVESPKPQNPINMSASNIYNNKILN
jgi:phosphate starvation-inducible protein PhoH